MSAEPYRVVSITPQGTAVARFMQAKALGRDDYYTGVMAAQAWRDTPHVAETLQLHGKSAVPAGSTLDATWAGPLSVHGLAQEAVTIMRGMSILGALESKMQTVPLRVKIAIETGTDITGGWVGAGAPIPVQKTAFATSIQEHYKYGVIVPLSEELVKLSTPAAITTINRTVLGGLAKSIDVQFLDPTVAAVANVNPASITNGATAITSTGSTTAQITADLRSIGAAVTTTGGRRTWIMRESTLGQVTLALGSNAPDLPRTLAGYPVIVSDNSPQQITLVDAATILFSDSGQVDLDVSKEASFQFDTAPDDPTTASTVFQTLFGRDLIAIRALRWLAWLRPISGSVAYMTVTY